MSTRLAIVVGLLAGILTATVAVALVVAFGPEVPLLVSPGPTSPAVTAAPSASMAPSAAAAATPPDRSARPSGPAASPSDGGGPFGVGEIAPSLRVAQLGGGEIDLAALRGHPVWIEFMATWCPSCRDEFPAMNGFAARYADEGLVVVAVDVREEEGTVATFANQLGATFPIGLDADGAAAKEWGAAALPVHFFVDAAGVVRDGAVGGIGPDIMAAGLSTIMPGVTVTP